MNKQFKLLSILSILVLLILAACGSNEEGSSADGESSKTKDEFKFLSVLTGGTQGTYYPLGGTFADLINRNGRKTTAEVSQASAANMTALQEWRR